MAGENNLGTLAVKITGDVSELKASLESASKLIATFTARISEQIDAFKGTIAALSRLDKVLSAVIEKQKGAGRIVKEATKNFVDLGRAAQKAGGQMQSALGRGFLKLDPQLQNTINAIVGSFAKLQKQAQATSTGPTFFDKLRTNLAGLSPVLDGALSRLAALSPTTRLLGLDLGVLQGRITQIATAWRKNQVEERTGIKFQEQLALAFKRSSGNVEAFVKELDKLSKASKGVNSALRNVLSNTVSLGRSFGHTVSQGGGLLKTFTGLDLKLKDFISRVILINVVWKSWNATLRIFRETIESIVQYDQALKNIQAITNATSEEIAQLDGYIRALSKQTAFSPTELANAFTLLGQAGFSAAEGMQALQSVALLATGTLSTTEDTVNLLTTAIRAFGLSADDSTEIANLFVAATNRTKLSIESLNTSFNFAGSAAHDAGLSIADTAAALGIMADNGIKASTQGTGLRQVVGNLIAPTKQFRDELNRLDININDINPLFNDLGDILQLLKDKGFAATSAFAALEKRTAGAFGVMVKNAEVFNKLRNDIQGTSAAVVAAEIQLGGLAQTSERLRNRLLNLFNTKDTRDFFRVLLGGFESVIDKVEEMSVKIKLLEVPFFGGNLLRSLEAIGQKISNFISFFSGHGGLVYAITIAWNSIKGFNSALLGLLNPLNAAKKGMATFNLVLGTFAGTLRGVFTGYLLNLLLEIIQAFKEAEKNTKSVSIAIVASAERIAVVEERRNKLLEERASLLQKIKSIEGFPAGKQSAEYEDLLRRVNNINELLKSNQEDLNNTFELGAIQVAQALRKEIDAIQDFSRKELEEFQSLKNNTDSLKSAYERLARARSNLADAQSSEERANALVEESDATERLVEQLKQLDPTVSGITPELAKMLDLFSSAEVFEMAAQSVSTLDQQLTEHGINLVNIQKEVQVRIKEFREELELAQGSNYIQYIEDTKVELQSLEQTLLAVGNAIQYIGQSTIDTRPDLAAFRDWIKGILKEVEPSKAVETFKGTADALRKEALELNSQLKGMRDALEKETDDTVKAQILTDMAIVQQQLTFTEQRIRDAENGVERAKNKLDALDKQSSLSLEERLKAFNKDIESNERLRKIELSNLELEKQQIDLRLQTREITEEEARVANLGLEQDKLRIENTHLLERVRLLRAMAAVIYNLQGRDDESFNQNKAKADAAIAEADALEDSYKVQLARIGLYDEEINKLSIIDQAWMSITETLEDDVAGALADMVFETQNFEDGLKGIGTALKDAFKNGFAASIKEKLHFDTIFKGNMLDLGNFAESSLGQAFSGIFQSAGSMLSGLASKFSGLFGAAGQTVPGTFAGTMGAAPSNVFIPTETFKTPTEMVTPYTTGAAGAAGTGMMAGLKAVAPFLAVMLGKEILDRYILPAMTSATDNLTKNSEQAQLGKKIGGEFFKWAFVMFTGGGLWDFFGLEKIGQLLGSAIGRLFGKQSTTKTFLSKIDDIVEPLLSQAFGTDIRIRARSSAGLDRSLMGGGTGDYFGKSNKVDTGDNIIRALVGTGQDYERLKQVQQALAAFGFVLGESFMKGKGAALSIKLVNAALFSLWQNADNLMNINLQEFFDGLAKKLGSFSFVIDNVNEELERLNKKIEKGKSVNPEIYKELENAIEGAALIFANEFPKGVDVAAKAIRQLRQNGTVDLEALGNEINQVVDQAAGALKSTFDDSLKEILAGKSLDNALETFKEKFDNFIKDTIFNAIIDAGINKAVTEGVITPLIDGINELQIRLQNGEIDFQEFGANIRRIVVRDVLPAMDIMKSVFSEVFSALASSIGIPLEELDNLFGEGSTSLFFSQDTVDKGKQFTQTWIEAANAIQDFYDVNVGQYELQDDILEKQKKIQELQEEYDRSGGRETYRKELQAQMDALQKEIDTLQDTIDAINSINLEESSVSIKVALINLKDAIGSVEELVAYYSILQQTLEKGIINETQMQNLLAAGIKSLQEELPAAINVLKLFNDALDQNGVLDVNKFRKSVEEATAGFNSLLEAVKAGVAEALSSGEAKKGVDAFAKYVKKTLGDSLLDAFVNAITNQIFLAALGPFFTDIGKLISDALSGEAGFEDIIEYIKDNMPDIMAALGAAGQALEPLLQAIIDIFTEMGLIDAYNDALDTQDELITKQLDVAKRWEDIFNQAQDTRNKILFGEGSSENALAQVTNSQRQLERELKVFRNAVTSEQRQTAASNLISLVDQVFGAAGAAGEAGIGRFQKGSLAFQQLQAELIAVLDEVSNTASTGMSQIDLLNQQLIILQQIADNTAPENHEPTGGGLGGGLDDPDGVVLGGPTQAQQTMDSLALVAARIEAATTINTNIYDVLNSLVSRLFPEATDSATTNGYTFNVAVNSGSGDAKEIANETTKSLVRAIRTGVVGSEIKRLSKPGR